MAGFFRGHVNVYQRVSSMGPTSETNQPLHGKSPWNFVSVNLPVSLMELDGIGWNWIELDAPHVRLWKSLFKMHLKSLQDLLEHILAWFSWGMFQELRYRNILSSHHPDWSCVDGAPLFEARYLRRKSWENHEHTLWIPMVIQHSFMTSNLATAPVGKNVCQVAQNDSKSMFENVCGS